MGKYFSKRAKGYFTVEASMIIPFVVLLIAFLFYLSFLLYNRCVLSQDAYILAFRGSTKCKYSMNEVEQYVKENSKKQFGIKYMGVDGLQSDIQVSSKKVIVKIEGKTKTSFMKSFGLENIWSLQASGEAERICPVDCVRRVRLLKKAGEKIQGMKTE